jgi:FlgD Ig-like domain
LRRLAPIILVVALLAGSAAAFAITERLKLEKSPITDPDVDRLISPLAERGGTAKVDFTLRRTGRITVEIVDANGEVVNRLITNVRFRKGRVHLTWDGRNEAGAPVEEGRYRPRVRFVRAQRTIVIPNPITVDLTAPKIRLLSVRPRVISPDHDGRAEFARIRFRVDEPARGLLLVDDRQQGKGRIVQHVGKLNWYGQVDGQTLPVGTYALRLRGEDRAENVSVATRAVRIRVRYVTLPEEPIRLRPGKRFTVHVGTDAAVFRWRLAGRSGRVRAHKLHLRAPRRPGRYTLYVIANDHSDKTRVVVAPRRQ